MFEIDALPTLRNEALITRRYGRITYTKDFLESHPIAIQKLYSRLIPVEVKYDFSREIFEIVALSDDFEPVEIGHPTPQYYVSIKLVKRPKNRAFYIQFQKVE